MHDWAMQDSGLGVSPAHVSEFGLVERCAGRQVAESATDCAADVGSLCDVRKPGAIQSAFGARTPSVAWPGLPPACTVHPCMCGSAAKWSQRNLSGNGSGLEVLGRGLLLQLLVLRLGGNQDRDVGIGVLPETEEILVRLARTGQVSLARQGAAQIQMREREGDAERGKAAIADDLSKLGRSSSVVTKPQVRLASSRAPDSSRTGSPA